MSKLQPSEVADFLQNRDEIRAALRVREALHPAKFDYASYDQRMRMMSRHELYEIGRAVTMFAGFEPHHIDAGRGFTRIGLRKDDSNVLIAKLLLNDRTFADTRLEVSVRENPINRFAAVSQFLPLTPDDPLNDAYVDPNAYALATSALHDTVWRTASSLVE